MNRGRVSLYLQEVINTVKGKARLFDNFGIEYGKDIESPYHIFVYILDSRPLFHIGSNCLCASTFNALNLPLASLPRGISVPW